MRKKFIQLYRNNLENNICDSFDTIRNAIYFHKYNNVLYEDKGSFFIKNNNLSDGEIILFRYGTDKIYETFCVIYRDKTKDDIEDKEGKFRNLSFFKSYEDCFKLVIKNSSTLNINGVKMITDINYDKQLIVDYFYLNSGNNISLSYSSNQLVISAARQKNNYYYANNGLSLIGSKNNILNLNYANNGNLGGVYTTSAITSTDNLNLCPIVNNIPYYKSNYDSGCGNDYSSINIKFNGSGWYRIAESTNNKCNSGIFNISAKFIKNNLINETTVNFIASVDESSLDQFRSINSGTIVQLSSNKSLEYDSSKNVISKIRIIFPKSYSTTIKSFIEVYVNSTNTISDIQLDISNLLGWNVILNNNNTYTCNSTNDTIPNNFFSKTINIIDESIIAENLYNENYKVIDSNTFADVNLPGIIKLKTDDVLTQNDTKYPLESENGYGYVRMPRGSEFTLLKATTNTLGGITIYNTISNNNFPLDIINSDGKGYFKCNILNSNSIEKGFARLGSNIDKGVVCENISGSYNKFYPVQVDSNNRLCVKAETVIMPKATTSVLGSVKIGSDLIANNIIVKNDNLYYPIQTDQNDRCVVKVPTTGNTYHLPVATRDILGGINVLTKVNRSYNLIKDTDGRHYPVVLDRDNYAFVKAKTVNIDNVNRNSIFTSYIYDNNEITDLFNNDAHNLNNSIYEYRKFVFYFCSEFLDLTYFLNAFTINLPDECFEVNIYAYKTLIYGEEFSQPFNMFIKLDESESGNGVSDANINHDILYTNLTCLNDEYIPFMPRRHRIYEDEIRSNSFNGIKITITNIRKYFNMNDGIDEIFNNKSYSVIYERIL